MTARESPPAGELTGPAGRNRPALAEDLNDSIDVPVAGV